MTMTEGEHVGRSTGFSPREKYLNTGDLNVLLATLRRTLLKRFYKEILPNKKKCITEDEMNLLLREYYSVRGWYELGRPCRVE